MEKREDCWWRESTLGEDVDVKVGTYLRANHQEYQEIRHQIDELIQQYPAVRALFESEDAVTLTAEEHKALIRYFCLESSVEMIVIIPRLFEPPVRTLRATIPGIGSHIFR